MAPFLTNVYACMLRRFSCVRLCATLWTVARQPLLSKGLSRQEYWSRLPRPPPGDLPNPGVKSISQVFKTRRVLYHQHHLGRPHLYVVNSMRPLSSPQGKKCLLKGRNRYLGCAFSSHYIVSTTICRLSKSLFSLGFEKILPQTGENNLGGENKT